MKPLTIYFALFFLLNFSALAQKTVYWTGGTPGQENNWHCSRNWNNGRVPDWSCDVVVPDLSTKGEFYPAIYLQQAEPIRSLTVHSNARLTVVTLHGLHVEGWMEIQGLLLDKSEESRNQATASSQ